MNTVNENARTSLALPPLHFRRGDATQQSDDYFLSSADRLVATLELECGLSGDSRVLDIGSGAGRLLHGLIRRLGRVGRYVGLDVSEVIVAWAQQHLEPVLRNVEFIHVPYRNERYNPAGAHTLDLPLVAQFDCIVLYSVFSHMRFGDIDKYLQFSASHLAPHGQIYCTLFVEHDAPLETENPAGYLKEWKGPLHCVRINKQAFEASVAHHGLRVDRYGYRRANGWQSSYVLGRRES